MYIVYSKQYGPLARIEGDARDARLRDGEIAIPCGPDADVNDMELWARKAEEWEHHVPTLEEAKARKLAELAAARYAAEIAGVSVGSAKVRTDRESQAMLTGAALQAVEDPAYTCRWKTENGFVQLDAEQIKIVAKAVRAHVQAQFDREAALTAQVEAAETIEAVEAISWAGEEEEDAEEGDA